MNIFEGLSDAIKICLFDKKTIKKVSDDKNSTIISIIIFLSVILISPFLLDLKFGSEKILYFFDIIFSLIAVISVFGLFHLATKLFGSKSAFISFLRPMGYSYILQFPLLLGIFLFKEIYYVKTIFSVLFAIWWLPVWFTIAKEVYKLKFWKTIALYFILFIMFLVILMIIAVVLFIAFPDLILQLRLSQ